MKAKSALIASIATVGIASQANAQDFVSGGPTAINGGPHLIDIVIGASGTIADLDVSLNISHVWVGDLDVTLTHVNTGTSAAIFGHVGGRATGDASDLAGVYRFDDESANSFPAAAVLAGAVVPTGTYFASQFQAPIVNPPVVQSFLSVFDGENIQGTWRLSILDTFPTASVGTLTNYTLHMTVPAPGALALLGLAGVAGVGRRRSRR